MTDPTGPTDPPEQAPEPGARSDPDAPAADPRPPPSGGAPASDPDRTAVAVWTLPYAVGLVVALALPWATCAGCAGPAVFTAWSLPDSDAIGVASGAEYGMCSIGGVLALALTIAALVTLRRGVAASAAVAAAATTAFGAYAIVTITGHGLNLEAGPPVAVGCAAMLTLALVRVRPRLRGRV